MAGIMYILQVAYSLGRPVSICVGMGSNLGNHDGASPLCHLIDINNMAGASIVACAGNEGPVGHHYEITKKEEEVRWDYPGQKMVCSGRNGFPSKIQILKSEPAACRGRRGIK